MLKDCGVIDKSLLLGIYGNDQEVNAASVLVADDGTKFSITFSKNTTL